MARIGHFWLEMRMAVKVLAQMQRLSAVLFATCELVLRSQAVDWEVAESLIRGWAVLEWGCRNGLYIYDRSKSM